MANGFESEGLSFKLPQSGGGASLDAGKLAAPKGSAFKPFEAEKNLATGFAEEKTYFKQLQDLNTYVEDQMSRGIDPTKPDLAEPDSILANRIFRQKKARVDQLANKLGQLGKLQTERAGLQMQGKILPGGPATQTGLEGTPLAPSVDQMSTTLTTDLVPAAQVWAEKFAGKELTGAGLKQAEEYRVAAQEQVEEQIQQLQSSGQYTPEQIEQYRTMQMSVFETGPVKQAPRAPSGAGIKWNKQQISERDKILKSMANRDDASWNNVHGKTYLGKKVSSHTYNAANDSYQLYHKDKRGDTEPLGDPIPASDRQTQNEVLGDISIDELQAAISQGWGYTGSLPKERTFESGLDEDLLEEDKRLIMKTYNKGEAKQTAALQKMLRQIDTARIEYDENMGDDDIYVEFPDGNTAEYSIPDDLDKFMDEVMKPASKYRTNVELNKEAEVPKKETPKPGDAWQRVKQKNKKGEVIEYWYNPDTEKSVQI